MNIRCDKLFALPSNLIVHMRTQVETPWNALTVNKDLRKEGRRTYTYT